VKGTVDDKLRALLPVSVSATVTGQRHDILAWVDTAFNGGLVIPEKQISELGLAKESSAEAILADGTLVELETFACCFHWFNKSYETQVISNDGEVALLGTMLLDGHRLVIDYKTKTVELQ
jgi:clan AA aspartic protease